MIGLAIKTNPKKQKMENYELDKETLTEENHLQSHTLFCGIIWATKLLYAKFKSYYIKLNYF